MLNVGAGGLTSFSYRPYGSSATPATPFGYTGQRFDGESGLYYYRARHYSTAWGRFLQVDPIGSALGPNLYAYAGNDPLNAIDPDGTVALQLGGAAAGAVVGVAVQAALDIYNWRLSSASEYGGAFVGGAAGGAAATVCGVACAGAAAGAASSLTIQALNGSFSASGFLVDTAGGAIGGAVAGRVVPSVFKNLVPSSVKGDIGEALSATGLLLSGETGFIRNAPNGVGRSTFDFLLSSGRYVESKFGTGQLSTPQRQAGRELGSMLEVHQWSYPTVSGIGGAGVGAGSASGWNSSK
jgi:RHS repeat-associated protein